MLYLAKQPHFNTLMAKYRYSIHQLKLQYQFSRKCLQ